MVEISIGRLRKALPELLEDGENGLPGSFRVLLAGLGEELRALDVFSLCEHKIYINI